MNELLRQYGAREMECCSFYGRDDSLHNGVDLLEIFKLFAGQDKRSFGTGPFYERRIYANQKRSSYYSAKDSKSNMIEKDW